MGSVAETTRVIPGRHARRDMRWLEVRGRTFYAVQAVPRPLWARVGKRRLLKSLGTRDHHVALARRHAALAEFQRTLDRVREPASADALVEAALEWRQTLAALEHGDTSRFSASTSEGAISDPDKLRTLASFVLEDEAGSIESERGRGPPVPLWGSREARLRRYCCTLTPGCARAAPRGLWRRARGRNTARTCRVLGIGRGQLALPPWKPSPTSWPAGM